ncbi:thiopurine S-methyltransferase [Ferrimonas gelatinilytica]|uniref:Thiopurine S-methyltransferase n=1 Tax=Ferrimonas gelatinilytica TaxID=1255257 RepID=A0ABP9S158_9GAMM
MEPQFWHQRWHANQIGFHLPHPNPLLTRHWMSHNGTVLVPLCGKSLDLPWLAERGHQVWGIELNEQAAQSLFSEQGLSPERTSKNGLTRFSAGPMTVLQGDFFDVSPQDLPPLTHFYDRAALIALPPEMRQQYVAHLASLLPSGAEGLLVTLDYPQSLIAGPPFSVPDQEVRQRFELWFEVEHLASQDILADSPKFQAKGVPWLEERVYRMVRR